MSELPDICRRVRDSNLLWALFRDNETRGFVIATGEGIVRLPMSEVPHLAAMVAQYCTDNSARAFVRDEWGDLWDAGSEETD